MKIKNTTTGQIQMTDMPGQQTSGLIIQGGEEIFVFNEDAEKSLQLKSFIDGGQITVLDQAAEPTTGTSIGDAEGELRIWVLMNDVSAQFVAGDDGLNGPTVPNNYTGASGTPVTVPIWITDGDGTRDIINSESTVQVAISGGSAPSKTINGGVGPVTVTFVKGAASVEVDAGGAGDVQLVLSSPTHPTVTLNVADTAVVALS